MSKLTSTQKRTLIELLEDETYAVGNQNYIGRGMVAASIKTVRKLAALELITYKMRYTQAVCELTEYGRSVAQYVEAGY